MKKTPKITPQLTCPKVLVLRHLIQYKQLDNSQRQTMSAAFEKYGKYVLECQQKLDGLLPHEPRDEDEIENAKELSEKVNRVDETNCFIKQLSDSSTHRAHALF